jgi:hypothetical protein
VLFAVNVPGAVAIPDAFVGTVAEWRPPVQVPDAPATGDANVTVTPLTGLPNPSLTTAASATGNAPPTAIV